MCLRSSVYIMTVMLLSRLLSPKQHSYVISDHSEGESCREGALFQ